MATKTIKIIDLLNKCLNLDVTLPKLIIFNNEIYDKNYDPDKKVYYYLTEYGTNLLRRIYTTADLNDEVEIIEEEKEIEKLEYSNGGLTLHYGTDDYAIVNHEKIIINKINELIDVLNEIRKEK